MNEHCTNTICSTDWKPTYAHACGSKQVKHHVADVYLGYTICCYNDHHFHCDELSLYGYNTITSLKQDMLKIRSGHRTALMLAG
jgi:hypothetical protein